MVCGKMIKVEILSGKKWLSQNFSGKVINKKKIGDKMIILQWKVLA